MWTGSRSLELKEPRNNHQTDFDDCFWDLLFCFILRNLMSLAFWYKLHNIASIPDNLIWSEVHQTAERGNQVNQKNRFRCFWWGGYSSLGTGFCSRIENKTSKQHNKNSNRTTDQGQHISDRQSEGEGFFFFTLIWLKVKPGSNWLWADCVKVPQNLPWIPLHNNWRGGEELSKWNIIKAGINQAVKDFTPAFDPGLTPHTIEGKRWEEELGGGRGGREWKIWFGYL